MIDAAGDDSDAFFCPNMLLDQMDESPKKLSIMLLPFTFLPCL